MGNASVYNVSYGYNIPISGTPALSWNGRIIPIKQTGITVVGRVASADLVIDDQSVSRRHAEIRADNGRYFIRDLGSTNGVFVSGQSAQQEIQLMPGCEIRLGHCTMTFIFTNPAPPLTATPSRQILQTGNLVDRSAPGQSGPLVNPPGEQPVPMPYPQNLQPAPAQNLVPVNPAPFMPAPPRVAPVAPFQQPDDSSNFAFYRIVVRTGPTHGQQLNLNEKSVYRIGRTAKVSLDLQITDPKVTDFYAYIMKRIDGGFAIRDNNSPSSIFLNGQRLTKDASALKHGDQILIGDMLIAFEGVPKREAY
jgi:pSer/pThr/pTyr-binding forkhead associated (FHA) protein